jgi:ribosome-associated protein
MYSANGKRNQMCRSSRLNVLGAKAQGRKSLGPPYNDFTMLQINHYLQIPAEELHFSFARSGGPGGQNVNKVASKAVLRWSLRTNVSVPEHVKTRLRSLHRNRVTADDEIVIQSQRYRDQERNRQDCLDKLREFILQAAALPKPRRATKPTRGSRERRLEAKKQQSERKSARRAFNSD